MPPSVYYDSLSFKGDAFSIFHVFKDQPHVFFLDSSLPHTRARFSYIGFAPFATAAGHDLSRLEKVFNRYRLPAGSLSFPAGAVGYLGYDGSLFFGFYDTILTVDHQKKKLIISSFSQLRIKDIIRQLSIPSGGLPPLRQTGYRICNRISTPREVSVAKQSKSDIWTGPDGGLDFKSNFTKAEYMQAVRQALEHIRRGDIYQINLSHQIRVDIPHWRRHAHPADIYMALRTSFPSEFGAYFDDGKRVALSASPERFLRLQEGIAQVKPMKGTRPRGKTKIQDKMLRDQLLTSPKEIAELLMVTDLERNDLGRVCAYGTVRVKDMRTIEPYSTVFQATSTVEGRLKAGCSAFDLLRATFPGGSVTGCPKIEAMKIIRQLERGSRGLYTGALGYMSFSGDMDFNVMIRTMFLGRDKITFHVGGGIVADSKPQAEWQETWVKAGALMSALKKVFP